MAVPPVRTLRVSFLALLLALPAAVSAQSISDFSTPFTLLTSPAYPAPNSTLTVTPESGSVELTSATMVITVNGKPFSKGAVEPFTVPLSGAGQETTVKVAVIALGQTSTQTVSVVPEDVALIAEPLATAPALYPGKPLVPLEGSVRVVAVAGFKTASGTVLDPNTLSYAWTVGGTAPPGASGVGKTSFMLAAPLQYRNTTVAVVVRSADGALVGGDTLTLTGSEPTVRVYERDPLLGLRFDAALSGTHVITGTEDSLVAVPYSFPLSAGTPSLKWFLSGASVQAGPAITLRPTGNGQGSANLSVTATAGDYVTAATNFSVSFSAQASTNLFGL